jgi:hypothetical protein
MTSWRINFDACPTRTRSPGAGCRQPITAGTNGVTVVVKAQ